MRFFNRQMCGGFDVFVAERCINGARGDRLGQGWLQKHLRS